MDLASCGRRQKGTNVAEDEAPAYAMGSGEPVEWCTSEDDKVRTLRF